MGRPRGYGYPVLNFKIGASNVSEGDALKGGTAKTAAALVAVTDGSEVVGFAAEDVLASTYGPVQYGGIFVVDAAAAFTPTGGALVVPASASTFDGGSTTNPVCGFVVDADAAADALFDMFLTSILLQTQTIT